MNKPTVLMLGMRNFDKGGCEVHCEELIKRVGKTYTISRYCRQRGLGRKLELICTMVSALIVAKCTKPDIVHIHNLAYCGILPALKFFQISSVVTIHSLNYEHENCGKFSRRVLLLFKSWVEKYADRIIVVSPCFKRFPKRKTVCIFNGVEKPTPVKHNHKFKPYGLYIGRKDKNKGLDLLDKAYKHLYEPDFDLKIVSNCWSKDQKAELYTNASFFVLPSFNEGLPLTLLEAMSYGLPIVTTDIPINVHPVLNNLNRFNVFIYERDDYKQLAEFMQMAFNRPKLSEELYKEQVKYITETFDWNKCAKQVEEVYDSIH